MSAVASDIVAARRPAKIISREDAAIQSQYPGARDNQLNPSTGYFDDSADATAALNIEGALIGVARRRFAALVQDVIELDPATEGVPTYTLTDAEQSADDDCLLSRMIVDFETETTNMELFG